MRGVSSLSALMIMVAGCTFNPQPPTITADAQVEDAQTTPDTGFEPRPDLGSIDGGLQDAGFIDAGFPDVGLSDTGRQDAGVPDMGVLPVDAGLAECGNGILEPPETCDDGLPPADNDGCNQNCEPEANFVCDVTVQPTRCESFPQVTIANASAQEGRPAAFLLSLSATVAFEVSLTWQTIDQTATAPDDYELAVPASVTIPAGISEVLLNVSTVWDNVADNDEEFLIQLTNPVNAVVASPMATGTIIDIPPLTDQGLVVRYFLDDVTNGAFDQNLTDAASPSFNLATRLFANGPAVAEFPVGQGARWQSAGGQGGFSSQLGNGNKLLQGLDGSPQATLEVVCDVQDAVPGSRLIHLGEANVFGDFSLIVENDALRLYRANRDTISWPIDLRPGGRQVVTITFDTRPGSLGDRLELYINGQSSGVISDVGPIRFDTIDLQATDYLALGNRPDGARSFQGILGYTAIYDVALDPADILTNAESLRLRDDAP